VWVLLYSDVSDDLVQTCVMTSFCLARQPCVWPASNAPEAEVFTSLQPHPMTCAAGASSAIAHPPEIVVSIQNEQRRSSTRDLDDSRRIAAVEEQRGKVQAAYDKIGEADSAMKMDLQLLLDRMDRQLKGLRDRQQSRHPCMKCLPCVPNLVCL
jgi:hypothetical protein